MVRFILFSIMCGIFLLIGAQASWAKDVPPPVPVDAVKSESLAPPPGQRASTSNAPKYPVARPTRVFSIPQSTTIPRPSKKPKYNGIEVASLSIPSVSKDKIMILELFSSQACPFCPKADSMMAGFIDKPDLIALSCHVDYFDVKKGSLSLPICSSRQIAYEGVLGLPKYTPQIVLNGAHDVVGYKQDEVRGTMQAAQETAAQRLKVKLGQKEGDFSVQLPDFQKGRYKIWVLAYDAAHQVDVKDGANAGKAMTYYNVVSDTEYLGPWDGQANNLSFDLKLKAAAKGFAVLVQEEISSRIVLAGKFIK